MGTNYYLDEPHNTDGHLGERSMGWVFSAYAPKGVDSFAQWIGQTEGHQIVNEYGEKLTLTEFLTIVTGSLFEPSQHPEQPAGKYAETADFEELGIIFHRYTFL